MHKAWSFAIVTLSGLYQLVLPTSSNGFDLDAHSQLSRQAVANSEIDTVLRGQLGFVRGVRDLVNGRQVDQWIADIGARREDSPFTRTRFHFHDPTLTWDQAGLRLLGPSFESSVLWGQDRGQVLGGKHSWHDARASFVQAATAVTDSARQKAYADTFRSLGHLIHLVQDAASPAHTRNDPHITVLGIGDPDSFHTWTERNLGRIAGNQRFASSLLGLPPNPLAPIPIARIIDTERYRQSGVPEALTTIGIAEYSNANFFSDDRLFSSYPFPSASSVDLGPPEREPKTGQLRRYLIKARDGETGYRLAVPSALFDRLQVALADQLGLDDLVLQDYGRLLFPRAIGYSAGHEIREGEDVHDGGGGRALP